MPHAKANNLKAVLEANRNPNIVCTSLEDIAVIDHKAYLDIMICYQLMKKWKPHNFFSDFNYVVPMIINRCIDPKSKIGFTKWVKKTISPQLLDIDYDDNNPYSIYRALDKINQQTTKIQELLYKQLEETDKTFFMILPTHILKEIFLLYVLKVAPEIIVVIKNKSLLLWL